MTRACALSFFESSFGWNESFPDRQSWFDFECRVRHPHGGSMAIACDINARIWTVCALICKCGGISRSDRVASDARVIEEGLGSRLCGNERERVNPTTPLTPAKAGVQSAQLIDCYISLGSRFRGNEQEMWCARFWCRSLDPADDPNVAHGTVAERAQRFLVAGAVVPGDRFFEAGEFRHDQPLFQPGLEGRVGDAAAQIAHAKGRERNGSKLRIGGDLGGVLDLAIGRNPVGFGHCIPPHGDAPILACARACAKAPHVVAGQKASSRTQSRQFRSPPHPGPASPARVQAPAGVQSALSISRYFALDSRLRGNERTKQRRYVMKRDARDKRGRDSVMIAAGAMRVRS